MTSGATTNRPTHDVSLTDGVNTVGLLLCDARGNLRPEAMSEAPFSRAAMQISQGATGYSDMQLPYTVEVQEDWSAGRGQEDIGLNASRYYDGNRMDTTREKCFINGPLETYTTGYYSSLSNNLDHNTDYSLIGAAGGVKIAASSITTVASIKVRRIRFWLKALTGAVYPVKVRAHIYTDSTGPNTDTAWSDWKSIASLTAAHVAYDFDIPETTLGATTKYWVGLEVETGITKKLVVGKHDTDTTNDVYSKTSGAWAIETADQTLSATVYTVASGGVFFFEFKGAFYVATRPDDSTTPTLWINGYRGMAKSNTADKTLLNTGLNLSGVDLTGCIVRIVSGPGSTEEFPFRTVLSNTGTGTDDVITVNNAWKIVHTTSTSFVVLGYNAWVEVTGHGLTKPLTDVCVVDTLVFFAQGDAAKLRHMKWEAGTYSFYGDSTNYAERMRYWVDQSGSKKIIRSQTAKNDVDFASIPAYGANCSFGSSKNCGSEDERINGVDVYGTPPIPYIFKEGSFGSISNSVYAESPNSEFASVRSLENGRCSIRHDMYLYFNLQQGLERYLNGHLDDMGPNRDAGLPHTRQGFIRHIVGYPGRFFACVDAGDDADHYSSVLCYNQFGWHEIYRAPGGKRIRRMYIQALPGLSAQRLWIAEEEDLVWLPISINPEKEPTYRYTPSSSIVTSWIDRGLKDVIKFWHSLKLFSEYLASGSVDVLVEYQTDAATDDSAWTTIGTFNVSPVQELDISSAHNVTGRRIRFRLTSNTTDGTKTPKIKAMVIESVLRFPPKGNWTPTFVLADYPENLNHIGQPTITALADLTQLKTWSSSVTTPAPLLMSSNNPLFDQKYVFIEAASVTPLEVKTEGTQRRTKAICRMTIYEA